MLNEQWKARVYCLEKRLCPSLFYYTDLSGGVEAGETSCTATLEASLGKEAGCEKGEMALSSEIPLAEHLLIKLQKEHAFFLPQCNHSNQ